MPVAYIGAGNGLVGAVVIDLDLGRSKDCEGDEGGVRNVHVC
jgi:hypothetical protein